MNCENIQDWLAEYWDLADDDIRKKEIQQHINGCRACMEQFELWKESTELIQKASDSLIPAVSTSITESSISAKVMNRIYSDESWRMPIAERGLGLTPTMRKLIFGCMAFFFALFVVSFLFALNERYTEKTTYSSIVPIASLEASSEELAHISHGISVLEGVPVASISDPLVMRITPLETDPNYWMIVSVLGLVCVISIMNWLSRVRV